MSIGMSTSNYYGRFTTEESLERLCQMGVRNFELFLQSQSEYTPSFMELVCRIRDEYGASFRSVHSLGTQFEPQLFATSERQRNDALTVYRQVIACAAKAGAKCYVMHGPARMKRKHYTYDYAKLGQHASLLCRIAADEGVCLTWENVHWAFYSRPEFAVRMLEYCPELCFTMDIKQAMQGDRNIFDFISVLPSDKILNVHVCDYDMHGRLCLPGEGIFDFARLFSELKRINYSGTVIEEVYAGQSSDDAALMKSFDFLRSFDTEEI